MKTHFGYWICLACSAFLVGSEGVGPPQLEERPEKVSFCELASNPSKYEGHVVITEGVVGNSFHSIDFFDPLCTNRRTQSGLSFSAQATFAPTYRQGGPLHRRFQRALDKDGSARLVVVGRFESARGVYGPGGHPFKLDLQSLIAVHKISEREREALGIGAGKGP